MPKLNQDFFINKEVLFVGYSSRNNKYSKAIYEAFSNNGIKVYPFNSKDNTKSDVKVYNSLDNLPTIPKCAYVLMNKNNTNKIVKQLADNGIKKILFHSSRTVEPATLDECNKMGIETAVACPMMIFGSGIHKIHGIFAGVR